ncbi:MAG: GntR family transcriptional regulator [Actinomycetaceae bacterium]|nr:GntR family transcriptional regulator [Arcanobacterium sp.]MDD7504786.1 GntR family transcriptional regulator [Actinomycetaceae bacterium]MDY6142685.1 GntR family transcriptional regulator [Arcanobacterium sp.]
MAKRKQSTTELVYNQIREHIMDGRFTPGYRLVLSTLADEYDVSTVPVREAIRQLEAQGLVEYHHNIGAMVTQINTEDYADSMTALAYLEGAATMLAAEHITPDVMAQCVELNGEMHNVTRASHFDPIEYRRLNTEFHRALCAPCPNRRVLALMAIETDRVEMIRRSSFKFNAERSVHSVEQHDHLLSLIRDGADGRVIELCAREHKLDALRRTLKSA